MLGQWITQVFGDRFKIVYWVIAAATAQHTAWGAATTMQGSQGESNPLWWLQGLAFAVAIDVSMVLVATKIRSGSNRNALRYALTFAGVALLSSYFQLLYAWSHINLLPPGTGVGADWSTRLQGLVEARLVIAPFALPVISILYTVAGLGRGGEKESNRSKSRSNGISVEIPRLPARSPTTKRSDAARAVQDYYEQNPEAVEQSPMDIARLLNVGKSTVYNVRKEMSSNGKNAAD